MNRLELQPLLPYPEKDRENASYTTPDTGIARYRGRRVSPEKDAPKKVADLPEQSAGLTGGLYSYATRLLGEAQAFASDLTPQFLQPDHALQQLKDIMSPEAFARFEQERSNPGSKGYPASGFTVWYNQNKSSPALQELLSRKYDTGSVKALKRQIVNYEMGALGQLADLTNLVSPGSDQKESIPQCLDLKPEDLFDHKNNYRPQPPRIEDISPDDIEEVLAWYRKGICENRHRPGELYDYLLRTLEKTPYSETEIARKLNKCLSVHEQRAVAALETLMPKAAYREFLTLMAGEPTESLTIASPSPLADWYNSSLDSTPEFIKPWYNLFRSTKACKAYINFCASYEKHARQKFEKLMGEQVFNSCYVQLPYMLPRDADRPPGYCPRENGYLSTHLDRVNSWMGNLSDQQWQQLSKGEARHSHYMNWLNVIRNVLGPHCFRYIAD